MGYYANSAKTTGSFFLLTKGNAPYCANQYMFELNAKEDSPKTAGKITFNLEPNDEMFELLRYY
jgi:hypothetical protein